MKNIIFKWLLFSLAVTVYNNSFSQGIRKHYEEMTDNERDDLMAAYYVMGGASGTFGLNFDIAAFHDENFDDIHFNDQENDVFFAWHRTASVELERAMRDNADNEWINIGYWDWTISNSKSDPLWNSSWIGQFNDPWDLNRLSSTSQTFPTQSDIDNALLEDNFYQFSRFEIEESPIYSMGHTWVGGVMATEESPKDPAFFFHHNMLDKIWADWYEIHGDPNTDYYTQTDMPRYPFLDPDDIVDPRGFGIFYAESELAILDKYTVNNIATPSEKFGYQYVIEAKDNFLVPSEKDAEFRSCKEIRLLPGFTAHFNSSFIARLDNDCDFSTSKLTDNGNTGSMKPGTGQRSEDVIYSKPEISLRSYPNPFEGKATIEYTLLEDTEISVQFFSIAGQLIKTLVNPQLQKHGTHRIRFDGSDLPNGLYYCSLKSEKNMRTIKMTVNN